MQLLWAKDIYDRLNSDELAKNVPDADKLLELHQERKVHSIFAAYKDLHYCVNT